MPRATEPPPPRASVASGHPVRLPDDHGAASAVSDYWARKIIASNRSARILTAGSEWNRAVASRTPTRASGPDNTEIASTFMRAQ